MGVIECLLCGDLCLSPKKGIAYHPLTGGCPAGADLTLLRQTCILGLSPSCEMSAEPGLRHEGSSQ